MKYKWRILSIFISIVAISVWIAINRMDICSESEGSCFGGSLIFILMITVSFFWRKDLSNTQSTIKNTPENDNNQRRKKMKKY